MLYRKVEELLPSFQIQVDSFLTRLDQLGIKYVISETYRSEEVQNAYWKQGRFPLEEVNKARKEAELWDISEKENKKITWTKHSLHQDRIAIDITPSDDGCTFLWNAPLSRWEEIAVVADSFGIEWGGRWRSNKDTPHFQMTRKE
jgi:peptidoglycan LD-endopeptidase CwlK